MPALRPRAQLRPLSCGDRRRGGRRSRTRRENGHVAIPFDLEDTDRGLRLDGRLRVIEPHVVGTHLRRAEGRPASDGDRDVVSQPEGVPSEDAPDTGFRS